MNRNKFANFPEEAFLYFPSDDEIVEYNHKKPYKTQRKIFEGGVKLYDYELDKLDELLQEINKRKIDLLDINKNYELLRILQGGEFNIENTLSILIKHLDWRRKYFPPKCDDILYEILNTGFIYIHGRDCRFRPVIVINMDKYISNCNKYKYEDWLNCIIFIGEYIKENMLLNGQIENWSILCDIGQTSVLNIPNDIRNLIIEVQDNYFCRLHIVLLYRISGFISFIWKLIKGVLDKVVVKKVYLIPEYHTNEIFRYINRDQVEMKYGGRAINKTKYFPPEVIKGDYLLLNENKTLLISKEEYVSKVTKIKGYEINQEIINDVMKKHNLMIIDNNIDKSTYNYARIKTIDNYHQKISYKFPEKTNNILAKELSRNDNRIIDSISTRNNTYDDEIVNKNKIDILIDSTCKNVTCDFIVNKCSIL